jgi:hypothetical protein
MRRYFRLEYWIDDGWYVGKSKDVPGVFSQSETFKSIRSKNVWNLRESVFRFGCSGG